MIWTKLSIETTCEAVDILSAFLYEKGVMGIMIEDKIPLTQEEIKTMRIEIPLQEEVNDGIAVVSCFLDEAVNIDELKAEIVEELNRLLEFMSVGTKKITLSNTEDKDWINNWKEFFKPFRLEDNIVIKPTWEKLTDVRKDDIIIDIDPGTSFGTGTHETTKLCIKQIKKYLKKNDLVLDVGCGSGILSITGLLLGAKYVHGIDYDPIAVEASIFNSKQNNLNQEKIKFSLWDLLSDINIKPDMEYDIVVANILADVIIDLSKIIPCFLKKNGLFIVSGIINTKEESVKEELLNNNFNIIDCIYMNDWVSIVGQKN